MKIAYFDCFAGVSGDMIVGALLDAGADAVELKRQLKKLKVSGYSIKISKTVKNTISGTTFRVSVSGQKKSRNLNDIVRIIDKSGLDRDIKESGKRIFNDLAKVEAKVHNKSIKETHFHELGAVDSIIDILGSLICIKNLGIKTVYSSRIHVGTGFVKCRHGMIPVPAPATAALLKGIPVYSKGIESELTTPTGAAVLKNIARSFGVQPEMSVEKIGYGAGSRDLPIPNLLRVYIAEGKGGGYDRDSVVRIEANIDDMNPEFFDYICETLLKKGCLDVYMTPIYMKRSRPATLLTVLVDPEKANDCIAVIFDETTTLGVRISTMERKKLLRKIIKVKTRFGAIPVKIGFKGKSVKNIAPEYERCKEAALKKRVPLKNVYDEAKESARKYLKNK